MANEQAANNAEVLAQALRAGKINQAYAHTWLDALNSDPEGSRRVLDALPAAPARSRAHQVPRASASQSTPRADGVIVESIDQMNARINADSELQAIAWKMGVRDGIEPPSPTYAYEPDPDSPQMVIRPDGGIDWVRPERDDTGTMLDPNNAGSPRSAERLDYHDRMRRQNAGDLTAWD